MGRGSIQVLSERSFRPEGSKRTRVAKYILPPKVVVVWKEERDTRLGKVHVRSRALITRGVDEQCQKIRRCRYWIRVRIV